MFKKLKEKKELENQFPIHRKKNSFDDSINSEENSLSNSCEELTVGLNTDEECDQKECDNNSNNNLENNSTNISINDSLNEQIIKLKNELICVQKLNTSLESQVIQYKNDYQLLNKELIAKNGENRQLKDKLSEFKSIGGEKEDLLLRNAELSNQLKKLKQDLEEERKERRELFTKFESLKESENNLTNDKTVSHLNETIVKLEESLNDRNKTIKLQTQRLYDIKKTFHKDLQNQSNRDENNVEESPKHMTISSMISDSSNTITDGLNGHEINFTYLKNVIFKYMISSEYEAIHLVKAISVLLNFTKEEEKLIKEMIEWKMSWFAPLVASKPSLHNRK